MSILRMPVAEAPPEINAERPGALLVVSSTPEDRWCRGRMTEALDAAGLKRTDANFAHLGHDVGQLIEDLRPRTILSLGDEAAWSLVKDWPSKDGTVRGAFDVDNRRGYLWPLKLGGDAKVLTTFHPEKTAARLDPMGHKAVLFMRDVERAGEYQKGAAVFDPRRTVRIVYDDAGAEDALRAIRAEGALCAVDIENSSAQDIACVGFAVKNDFAYVFTPKAMASAALLLRDASVPKLFQNGQYDLYFLLTRCGIRVAGYVDDTIVAWHSCYPELAGAAEGGKKRAGRRTRKSLAFLASLYSYCAWWKDYDFQTEAERYVLCGRDCCTTLEIMTALRAEIAEADVERIYRSTLQRIWPAVVMQQRGLLIDEKRRADTQTELERQRVVAVERAKDLAEPLLTERRSKLQSAGLIWERIVCGCCRGAVKKLQHCWTCAGFAASPGKAMLLDKARRSVALSDHATGFKLAQLKVLMTMSKADLEHFVLTTCVACGGRGKWERYAFNPASGAQVKDLLYNALHLPVRMNDGAPTSDEAALKSLLGYIRGEDLG